MSDADRPKSSWQSWVRSTERVRSAAPGVGAVDDGAVDDVAVDEPDRPLASDLSFEPIDGPLTPAGARRVAPVDDLADEPDDDDGDGDEPSDDPADGTGTWTTWSDDDVETGEDDLDDDDVDDGDDDDDDDHDGFGELLPTVPLLPSIAGRVEALSGVLRAISHRVDGLSASTDVYRATVVDRIDQFTETVLEQGRHTDQALDEYRRTTERTIAELRRRVGEQADGSKVLLARVEEIATDLTSLLEAGPAGAAPDPALAAELAQLRALVLELPAEPAATLDPAWVAQVDAALDGLARSQDATKRAVDDLAAGQAATGRRLDQLQGLVEVVVDTMPASAEGSAVDVAGALADVRAAIAALASKVDRPAPAAAAPAPAPAPIDVAALADAVVDRIDLDALAMLVAEHLSATFEVVDEVPAPAEPPPARRARKA